MFGVEFGGVVALERNASCQSLIEDASQCVDVRTSVHRLVLTLLGAHVEWVTDHLTGSFQLALIVIVFERFGACRTEIDNLNGSHFIHVVDDDLVRVESAMHDAQLVALLQCVTDKLEDGNRSLWRHRSAVIEELREAMSWSQFQY